MMRRSLIEAAIEALIDLLDSIDGDPDAEPEVEEPETDSEPLLAVPIGSDFGCMPEPAGAMIHDFRPLHAAGAK
jgi:hypothetical protein